MITKSLIRKIGYTIQDIGALIGMVIGKVICILMLGGTKFKTEDKQLSAFILSLFLAEVMIIAVSGEYHSKDSIPGFIMLVPFALVMRMTATGIFLSLYGIRKLIQGLIRAQFGWRLLKKGIYAWYDSLDEGDTRKSKRKEKPKRRSIDKALKSPGGPSELEVPFSSFDPDKDFMRR